MADHHAPAPVSQSEIDRAETLWRNFTVLMKVTVAGAVILLGAMALLLV